MNMISIHLLRGERRSRGRAEHGTSLLELLIAVALFVVISGVAFTLMNQQQNSSLGLSGQVGLNMALRNTMSMLQMDLANAGSNFYQDTNIPNPPVGVTILNNVVTAGSSCYNSASSTPYGTNCFDQLNVITVDPTYPTVNATDSTGGTSETTNCSLTNSGVAYGQAGTITATGTAQTLAQTANDYTGNEQLLLVTQNGAQYTSVVLTAKPTVVGSAVKFTFAATTSTGSNTLANDPLNISACSGTTPCPPATVTTSQLTDKFCGTDYILKLSPITYQVNSTNTTNGVQNPILTRTQNGTTSTVMEQVLGFKAGGAVWHSPDPANVDITYYNYDASSYTLTPGSTGANAYNFADLTSVRVSVIGRTTPSSTNNYVYQNAFDGGRYQVQGMAMVVNPRNMNF